jgi:hypothetical protein
MRPKRDVERAMAERKSQNSNRPLRVYLAEDDAAFRGTVARLLRKDGHEWTVVPRPGSLSAQMRPPYASTIRRAM